MNKLTIYYFLVAAILVGKTVATLYERSLVVHHGHSLMELQLEKRELIEQQLVLTATLANQTSLASIESSQLVSEFQPISKPVVINNPKLAASQL